TVAGTFPDRFAANASLYGVWIVTEHDDSPHLLADKIEGEMYLAFAEHDQWVPGNVIPDLTTALDTHGVVHEIETYPGTEHGYAFPEREMYNEAAAEATWAKMFALYERRLG
ncbi:MAG: dienelactone hydrolase family protein, partial [Alphaproteobacteria bacterium]|nr:dienelactone hydrolase family protein [Alphaproteobacteria bacterium]MCZ6844689.1 dienelactone hydrolase family protein [Alphaproteobacteria bacterium]